MADSCESATYSRRGNRQLCGQSQSHLHNVSVMTKHKVTCLRIRWKWVVYVSKIIVFSCREVLHCKETNACHESSSCLFFVPNTSTTELFFLDILLAWFFCSQSRIVWRVSVWFWAAWGPGGLMRSLCLGNPGGLGSSKKRDWKFVPCKESWARVALKDRTLYSSL